MQSFTLIDEKVVVLTGSDFYRFLVEAESPTLTVERNFTPVNVPNAFYKEKRNANYSILFKVHRSVQL